MNNKPEFNFIVVRLCDNDFGHYLKNGLGYIIENYGITSPEEIRLAMIEYVTCANKIDSIMRNHTSNDIREYLEDRLRVTFDVKFPTYTPYENGEDKLDDDGGSVCYDVNREVVELF
jgi:hypothetical protein